MAAKKFFVSEVVDLICEDFSDSESEEEGGGEVYSYRGGAILQAGELESLAKAVTFSISNNGSDFCSRSNQNTEESKDTVGCAEEEMELDVPGKNMWLA